VVICDAIRRGAFGVIVRAGAEGLEPGDPVVVIDTDMNDGRRFCYRSPAPARRTVFGGLRTIGEPMTSGYVFLERQVKTALRDSNSPPRVAVVQAGARGRRTATR